MSFAVRLFLTTSTIQASGASSIDSIIVFDASSGYSSGHVSQLVILTTVLLYRDNIIRELSSFLLCGFIEFFESKCLGWQFLFSRVANYIVSACRISHRAETFD